MPYPLSLLVCGKGVLRKRVAKLSNGAKRGSAGRASEPEGGGWRGLEGVRGSVTISMQILAQEDP
eukprot:1186577-Prorocentrum_minimum.AAC.2